MQSSQKIKGDIPVKDYYEILGISKNATQEQIKEAYRQLVKKYHPDMHINNPLGDLAAEKFREIQEAYEALTNGKTNNSQQYSNANTHKDYSYDAMIETLSNLIQEKKWRPAIKLAEEAININPNNPNAYTFKSIAHFSVNEYSHAEIESARAISQGNLDSYTMYVHGQSLVALQKYTSAIQSLSKFLELHDEDADIVGSLALSYEKLGDKDKGKYYWDRLAYLDPNNQMLQARKSVWNTGNGNYISKSDGKNAACFICVLLECIFDCL